MEKLKKTIEKMLNQSNKRKKGYEPALYDAAYEHGYNDAIKAIKREIERSELNEQSD